MGPDGYVFFSEMGARAVNPMPQTSGDCKFVSIPSPPFTGRVRGVAVDLLSCSSLDSLVSYGDVRRMRSDWMSHDVAEIRLPTGEQLLGDDIVVLPHCSD